VGAGAERANLDVVRQILALTGRDESLIRHVTDRPGHDRRYAIDASKLRRELGWQPAHAFEEGLAATVAWYRDNRAWWSRVLSAEYRAYYATQYGGQLTRP
jgi:dTDP-glucose 4,6-dehydratase